MKIALTAFEPFGGRSKNRSAQVLERVGQLAGVTLDRRILPVVFAELPAAVDGILAGEPDAVVLMGEADRASISVERIGLNVVDARLPDNRGEQPVDRPVVEGGPLALRSRWNAAAVRDAVRAAGMAVEISDHAGTYACNAALYLSLSRARCPVGFLHVPASGWPFGPRLVRLVRAVEAALAAVRDTGGITATAAG